MASICLFIQILMFLPSITVKAEGGVKLNSSDHTTLTLGNSILNIGLSETRIYTTPDTAAIAQNYFNKPEINGLEISNLLTPNGDGSNDVWIIQGIEEYPENSVQIFSRWGNKIRDFNGYNNSGIVWDGTNLKNEILPSGTYFYLLEIKNLGVKKGCIYLTSSNN